MELPSYEKLGAFYLGKGFDLERGEATDDLILYDSKDLTTHAVCVGMTGSGKTGLCLSLLEEAAIDGIPAIVIDPKGDLGNLLLTFPELRPSDFLPWIDPGEATRRGRTVEEHARSTAEAWKSGLAAWGQDGSRIARFRDAAETAIYTPGSDAGRPLSVLRSLAAPPERLREDADAMRDRVEGAVSGILALLGIDADPIRSREHILLSSLVALAWREGRSVDLASLIREIQSPPLVRVGVLDLESFYPARDRFELAMALNNLLGSPGFAAWLDGDPLDVARLLWTPGGKPRLSIVSIAHLSERERMFAVTLLLNEIVAWMRAQPGSGSLRAILYMDEVFGYLPPTAMPPSKKPFLTLLKQARAYGLGVVLATQNPVDLDYKALSNAGTWLLGRLQTERDQARVLDGLEGASTASGGAFDRRKIERILSGLGQRVFLMNNVHDDAPEVFQTRWVLSYLRGPLTRAQIQTLMRSKTSGEETPPGKPPREATPGGERPVLPPEVEETFIARRGRLSPQERIVYRPALLASARLHFVDARRKIDAWKTIRVLASLADESTGPDPWEEAEILEEAAVEVVDAPIPGASFAELPPDATNPKSYAGWTRSLKSHVYRTQTLTLWRATSLGTVSEPGESDTEFRVRLGQEAREERDRQLESLRERHAPKLARLQERIRSAEARVRKEESQHQQAKRQSWISIGATVLGALLGRKTVSVGTVGRATTAVRGMGRAEQQKDDVDRARESVESIRDELEKLERSFQEDVERVEETLRPEALALEPIEIGPRKSDIVVTTPVLAWVPS